VNARGSRSEALAGRIHDLARYTATACCITRACRGERGGNLLPLQAFWRLRFEWRVEGSMALLFFGPPRCIISLECRAACCMISVRQKTWQPCMDDNLAILGESGRTLKDRVWQGVRYAAFASLFSALPALLRGERLTFVVAVAVSAVCGSALGAIYYYTESIRAKGGLSRTFANVITLLAFAAAVLGVLFLAAVSLS